MLPQQLEARLSSAQAVDPAPLAAGAAETTTATHAAPPAGRGSSSINSSNWQAAGAGTAGDDADHAVLRPMQVQQLGPAGDAATSSAAGLRPSRQRQQQQEQAKSKQQQQPLLQQVVQQEQQQTEALTPRAARLQRRLQLQLQQQQQQGQQQSQHDAENTHPAARGVSDAAAGGSVGQKAQVISAEEYSQLPSWCKSLLTADLLNGVLQELSELSATRWGGAGLLHDRAVWQEDCRTDMLVPRLHTAWIIVPYMSKEYLFQQAFWCHRQDSLLRWPLLCVQFWPVLCHAICDRGMGAALNAVLHKMHTQEQG